MKTTNILLTLFIVLPIRFYLMWYILKTINATELPMFLFWVSIPLAIIISIISEVVKSKSINSDVTVSKKSSFQEKLEAASTKGKQQ